MSNVCRLGAAAVAVFAAGTPAAHAAVLTILSAEGLNNPDYANMVIQTNMDGLTYDNVNGTPVGTETAYGGHSGYSDRNRTSAFDLGENWADLRIVETWSYSRTSSPVGGDTPTGFSMLWWDDTLSGATFDDGAGDVEETTLNFFLNTTAGESNTWFRDVALTELTAVTPQGRYLKVVTSTDFENNNVFSEIAFVGYVVPEPASLALLALGGLGLVSRRARRRDE